MRNRIAPQRLCCRRWPAAGRGLGAVGMVSKTGRQGFQQTDDAAPVVADVQPQGSTSVCNEDHSTRQSCSLQPFIDVALTAAQLQHQPAPVNSTPGSCVPHSAHRCTTPPNSTGSLTGALQVPSQQSPRSQPQTAVLCGPGLQTPLPRSRVTLCAGMPSGRSSSGLGGTPGISRAPKLFSSSAHLARLNARALASLCVHGGQARVVSGSKINWTASSAVEPLTLAAHLMPPARPPVKCGAQLTQAS